MNNLTTIAALPQAGGCMSALPAERMKPIGNRLVTPDEFVADLWQRLKEIKEHDELAFPPIDLGPIGGVGC